MLPQLRRLERKYGDALVVIGVHSAKFMAEKATENLREAILRYDIAHPVINDADFAVWRTYGVRAWPTFFFIDPRGNIIGKHEGELPGEPIDRIIGQMVREFDALDLLDRRPLAFRRDEGADTPLRFPGKVAATVDPAGGRLLVSDTNHHRLIVAGLDGSVHQIVGAGARGFADGPLATATFNAPQGVAVAPGGAVLYAADTENHAIRRVDLAAGTVETIAGTGEQGRDPRFGGPGRAIALNSPWDLTLVGGTLFIAMAGFHQVWALDLATGEVAPYAGSARENILDGPLRAAQLAQPSGITSDGAFLYIADSETSAVRAIGLDPADGAVRTLVGTGLFDFGDEDGAGDEVRLQHPLGVLAHAGALYIADTYNDKIKRLDPRTRVVETFCGSTPGHADGPAAAAQFREPSGLAVAGGNLYVADTNNHAIRVVALATGDVATLELRGLEK